MTSLNNKKKTPIIFFIIVVLAVMPILMGSFLFQHHDFFKFKTLNYGVLINPPIQVQKLKFIDNNKKKWQLIYIPTGCCDKQCEKKLYLLHQIQKALSTDGERINLVFSAQQTCQQELLSKMGQQYNFHYHALSNPENKKLHSDFSRHSQKEFVITNKIYIVDPRGYLFMYYPNKIAPVGILKDLKILLQTSQIG